MTKLDELIALGEADDLTAFDKTDDAYQDAFWAYHNATTPDKLLPLLKALRDWRAAQAEFDAAPPHRSFWTLRSQLDNATTALLALIGDSHE